MKTKNLVITLVISIFLISFFYLFSHNSLAISNMEVLKKRVEKVHAFQKNYKPSSKDQDLNLPWK